MMRNDLKLIKFSINSFFFAEKSVIVSSFYSTKTKALTMVQNQAKKISNLFTQNFKGKT